MQIIISKDLRQKIMADHHIDKCQMSRILNFKVNSAFAAQLRSEILNFNQSMLVC